MEKRNQSLLYTFACYVKRQATEKCDIKNWKKAIFKMSGYYTAVKCQLNKY